MKSRARLLIGGLFWILVLGAAFEERLSAACEDCYECNTHVGGLGSSAECCSGGRCQVLANDDHCFQVKDNVQDCATSAPWWQPEFEHCTGSTPCGAAGGGSGGGAGGDGCGYQPGGFCPASCMSCSGGPYWY